MTNVSAAEAFQHYASLYIKYLQIFRKLETAYDNMLHPQKRLDVKTILELVQARVVELKHALVRWAPRNPDLNPPKNKLPPFPFPWEYVNLDDIIVDLKLPPAMLEVPVAKYYVEDRQEDLKNRNKVLQCQLEPCCRETGAPVLICFEIRLLAACARVHEPEAWR